MKSLSEKGALWLNRRELTQPKYANLHNALAGYDGIFEHFQMGVNDIREIQTFSWKNSNKSCDENKKKKKKFRAKSELYTYKFDKTDGSVQFKLIFDRKRIKKQVECSISLKIKKLPFDVESVATEMDIICDCDGDVHRSLMRKQKLSSGDSKGVVVFRSENVDANSSISWKVAIRMEPKLRDTSWNEDSFPVWDRDTSGTPVEDRKDDMWKEDYDELKQDNDALNEKYGALKKEYDALKEYNDGLMKKHDQTLMELEEIKKEKETVKVLHLKKEEEVKRLQEQLRQNGGGVQTRINVWESLKQTTSKKSIRSGPKKGRGRRITIGGVRGKKDRKK